MHGPPPGTSTWNDIEQGLFCRIGDTTGRLDREGSRMDTVVRPNGSQGWDIEASSGRVGAIVDTGAEFEIIAEPGTVLEGIHRGGYPSMEEALMAISAHAQGICRKIDPA